jgi:hypothetical protein
MPQVLIVNVFANASHPFVNPLFEDNTFELIPIPENHTGRSLLRYRDLRCFNSDELLTRYLPRRYHYRFVHSDPDLVNITYGDVKNPRSTVLDRVARNDWVAFYALLTPIQNGRANKSRRGFYIVAVFQVKAAIRQFGDIRGSRERRRRWIINEYGRRMGHKILENAHTRRWLDSPQSSQKMRVIIVGGRGSRRFRTPLPLKRALCEACFRNAAGKPWRWDRKKSELQTIGSYLRSVRVANQQAKLIELFHQHSRKRPSRLYSYIVASDFGFAPCAKDNLLTLACCKPKIRSTARVGDWVMGTTPKNKGAGNLVFLARVDEKMTFATYYRRFGPRRPDNIYRPRRSRGYVQIENPFHSRSNKNKDLVSDAVLLSKEFVYYGGSAPPIPSGLRGLIAATQGHKTIKESASIKQLIDWARKQKWGIRGQPADGSP